MLDLKPGSGGGRGKGGIRPGRQWEGGSIWRGENMEFWNLAVCVKLPFVLQRAKFLHSLISHNTPTQQLFKAFLFGNVAAHYWQFDFNAPCISWFTYLLAYLLTHLHSQFLDHTPTVSAPRPHTKHYVHQETYTAKLTDHSPAVKLYRRSTLSMDNMDLKKFGSWTAIVLLAIAIRCFYTIRVFANSAQNLKFCMKFGSRENHYISCNRMSTTTTTTTTTSTFLL